MEIITFDKNNNLTINTKPIVKITTSIGVIGTNSELPIEIVADFTNIPTHLHETYLLSLQSGHYSGKIYDNTSDEKPKTIEEKKRDWTINKIVDIIFGK